MYVVGTQKNLLNEMVLFEHQKHALTDGEIKKNHNIAFKNVFIHTYNLIN